MTNELIITLAIWAAIGLLGSLLAWFGKRQKNVFLTQLGDALKALCLDAQQLVRARAVGVAVPIIAVVVALLSGCSGDTEPGDPGGVKVRQMPMTVTLSDRFNLLDEALLFSAWDEWRIATGGALTVYEDPSGDTAIELDSTVNYGSFRVGRIAIEPGLPDDVFRTVALHEFGHAFGMPHLVGGLMRPYDGGEFINCIDAETIATVCAAYPCTNPRSTCR